MSKQQLTFQEKMQELRKKNSRWDPDATRVMRGWESRMAELQVDRDWAAHPTTHNLKEIAVEQIQAINSRLSSDESLDDAERKALFAAKDAHMAYMAALSSDPVAEMEAIENAVDNELK